ncbi:MAG: proline iminopeptidase-family hydrolase [Synergistaceae bacterium]|nr:proline iminopeptidase-family hydrolase [Synergistaceae bacterium]
MSVKITNEYVDVSGGFVCLKTLREKDNQGTPVLYIHGGPGGSFDSFKPMAETLAERHTVYLYNQLGSDESSHTGEESLWTPDRYIETLGGIIGGIGAKPLHLIGHSWGAYLAAEHLLRNPDSTIASVTMISPLFSTRLWISDAKKRLAELGEDYLAAVERCESEVHFDDHLYKKIIGEYNKNFQFRAGALSRYSVTAAFKPKTISGMKVYRYMWGPSEFTCTGILKDIDITGRLGEIKVPSLLICGEFDEVRAESCEYFRSLIPGAKMEIIHGASQTSFLEQPRSFYATLRGFYDAL